MTSFPMPAAVATPTPFRSAKRERSATKSLSRVARRRTVMTARPVSVFLNGVVRGASYGIPCASRAGRRSWQRALALLNRTMISRAGMPASRRC